MKVTKISPPPVVVPPTRVVIEMTEEEAKTLKELVGAISGTERDLNIKYARFSTPEPRLVLDTLYHALDMPVTAQLDVPSEYERQLFLRGEKITAIKEYRQRTGAGLKEAKDIIETIR